MPTTSPTPATSRPTTVTVAVVLLVIGAVLGIIAAIILLLNLGTLAAANNVSVAGTEIVFGTLAGISIIVSVIMLIACRGLLRGSSRARLVVTVLLAIQIVQSIIAVIQGASIVAQAGTILVPVIVLIFLYVGQAAAFFGGTKQTV